MKIKQLRINRFKGLSDLDITFSHETLIKGANATGKTTIMDAFLWLLFGKDNQGRTDFEVKTINKDGSVTPKLEYSIEGVLELEGSKQVELKRVYREKWVKKRGSKDAEMSGHETLYFWNEAPVTMKEYNERIGQIINEGVFRLITSPTEFVSRHWQKQREFLFEIAEVDDSSILDNPKFKELARLMEDKSFSDLRMEVSTKIRKVKAEMELIPARTDEVHQGMPKTQDWDALKGENKEYSKQIADLEKQMADVDRRYDKQSARKAEIYTELSKLRGELAEIEYSIDKEKVDKKRELDARGGELKSQIEELKEKGKKTENVVSRIAKEVEDAELRIIELRNEWHEANSSDLSWNNDEFSCPTCERPLDQDQIDKTVTQATENFNTKKAANLELIKKRGVDVKSDLKDLVAALAAQKQILEETNEREEILTSALEGLGASYAALDRMKSKYPQRYADAEKEIAALQMEAEEDIKKQDTSDLRAQRDELAEKNRIVEKQLYDLVLIDKANKRIGELDAEMDKYAIQLAELEKIQMGCEDFMSAKVKHTEERINSLFEITRFKLFDVQINGGITDTCIATVDGVPYTALNSASRIKAGIDIINTISSFYGVSAPIFIDNRESVTEIPKTESQLVNLYVSPEHKELVFENK